MIYLESVGCYINSESLCTYAALKKGGYDLETETHIEDCCEEWYEKLSEVDKKTVELLKTCK